MNIYLGRGNGKSRQTLDDTKKERVDMLNNDSIMKLIGITIDSEINYEKMEVQWVLKSAWTNKKEIIKTLTYEELASAKETGIERALGLAIAVCMRDELDVIVNKMHEYEDILKRDKA